MLRGVVDIVLLKISLEQKENFAKLLKNSNCLGYDFFKDDKDFIKKISPIMACAEINGITH